jgi:hypothetical protein
MYTIGLLWANPDTTLTPKYDALVAKLSFVVAAPTDAKKTCGPIATAFASCTASVTM